MGLKSLVKKVTKAPGKLVKGAVNAFSPRDGFENLRQDIGGFVSRTGDQIGEGIDKFENAIHDPKVQQIGAALLTAFGGGWGKAAAKGISYIPADGTRTGQDIGQPQALPDQAPQTIGNSLLAPPGPTTQELLDIMIKKNASPFFIRPQFPYGDPRNG